MGCRRGRRTCFPALPLLSPDILLSRFPVSSQDAPPGSRSSRSRSWRRPLAGRQDRTVVMDSVHQHASLNPPNAWSLTSFLEWMSVLSLLPYQTVCSATKSQYYLCRWQPRVLPSPPHRPCWALSHLACTEMRRFRARLASRISCSSRSTLGSSFFPFLAVETPIFHFLQSIHSE